MTPGEVCDLAYVLLLDQLERHVLAERQVAAVYDASGRFEKVELPTVADRRRQLDEALTADPVPAVADTEQMQLRRALGVA